VQIILALVGVGIAVWALSSLFSPPKKHKDFSDRDRLEATTSYGGSGTPPELPTPDVPEKKQHKHKSK